MIIAHISDTHIALDAPDADRRIRDFAATIADINALDPAPDVIVHTGDVVHNGRPDEYAQAAALLARARAPVYVLAGNKDDRAELHAAFLEHGYLAPNSEFIDYVIDTPALRLIALDTQSAGNKGDFCQRRLARLRRMLDAGPGKPVAVFTHHPLFEVTVGPDRMHFETADAMLRLASALQASNRVVGVFSGHVHRAAEGRVGTVPAIVVPCIATPLRKGEYPARMQACPVYYLHRFEPSWGFITAARVVRPEGATARTVHPGAGVEAGEGAAV